MKNPPVLAKPSLPAFKALPPEAVLRRRYQPGTEGIRENQPAEQQARPAKADEPSSGPPTGKDGLDLRFLWLSVSREQQRHENKNKQKIVCLYCYKAKKRFSLAHRPCADARTRRDPSGSGSLGGSRGQAGNARVCATFRGRHDRGITVCTEEGQSDVLLPLHFGKCFELPLR